MIQELALCHTAVNIGKAATAPKRYTEELHPLERYHEKCHTIKESAVG